MPKNGLFRRKTPTKDTYIYVLLFLRKIGEKGGETQKGQGFTLGQ
jgi:hypothetical protein